MLAWLNGRPAKLQQRFVRQVRRAKLPGNDATGPGGRAAANNATRARHVIRPRQPGDFGADATRRIGLIAACGRTATTGYAGAQDRGGRVATARAKQTREVDKNRRDTVFPAKPPEVLYLVEDAIKAGVCPAAGKVGDFDKMQRLRLLDTFLRAMFPWAHMERKPPATMADGDVPPAAASGGPPQ